MAAIYPDELIERLDDQTQIIIVRGGVWEIISLAEVTTYIEPPIIPEIEKPEILKKAEPYYIPHGKRKKKGRLAFK